MNAQLLTGSIAIAHTLVGKVRRMGHRVSPSTFRNTAPKIGFKLAVRDAPRGGHLFRLSIRPMS